MTLTWLGRASAGWVPVTVTAVAFALRAMTAGSDAVTADEPRWMARSEEFRGAVVTGDFARATAAADEVTTMPGVTTMWVGAAAGRVWDAGHARGWWAEGEVGGFPTSPSGMDMAQVGMAAVVAGMAGVLTALLVRWVGRAAAAVAGLLVATEPFLVAHGALLHTDELTALAGCAALVALALVLGVPQRTSWAGRPLVAAMAGALFGIALLTKVSAVAFVPGAALLGAWALARTWRGTETGRTGRAWTARTERWAGQVTLVRLAVWVTAATVAVVVAAYPALWVAPRAELAAIKRSSSLATEGHVTFFLGEAVATPGPLYFAVALPLRMTPWFLVAAVAAALAVWWRPTRGTGLALAAMGVPPLVIVSLASKQFDRYGLPSLIVATVLVGVVVAAAAREAFRRWPGCRRRLLAVGAVAAGAIVVHAVTVVPWGLAYFDPLLGGSSRAMDTVLVGWREGLEEAGPIIADHAAGRCHAVTIDTMGSPRLFPCGRVRSGDPTADYVVAYVSERQRSPAAVVRSTEGRPLLGTVEARGITYAEVYGPRSVRLGPG